MQHLSLRPRNVHIQHRGCGIRFDAAHQILDPTTPHFLVELGQAVCGKFWRRPIHLILKDERNLTEMRDTGLHTTQWNDGLHHAIHALLTGEAHAYFERCAVDSLGDFAQALAEGQCEIGQPRRNLDEPRGEPSGHLP